MKEPYLSRFREKIQAGAGHQDIHDGAAATGYAVTESSADAAFIEREVGRVAAHQANLCSILEQHVGRVGRVLDVGCSTGGTTVAVALSEKLGASEIVGADPNPLSIEAAEIRAAGYDLSPDRVRFVATIADRPLPFADDTFDLTVCVSVLEFLSTPSARQAFVRELQRVTRPGGYLYLSTPNPYRLREFHSRRWLGDFRRRDGYPWASSPRQIRAMCHNVTAISLDTYGQKVRARLGAAVAWIPQPALLTVANWLAPWQKLLVRKEDSLPAENPAASRMN